MKVSYRFQILILLFLATGTVTAQQWGQGGPGGAPNRIITGTVIDADTKAPLEFATVAVYSKRDSSLASGGITDEAGSFAMEVKGKAFYIDIEYIGYQLLQISDLEFERGGSTTMALGNIEMSVGGINLDAIEVTAERSELQFALDKRVFNVGKDLSSSGGNAQDVLDNIPSVSVGVEGEVELRGSQNVRILINGRPSGLLGVGDNNGLRNIQASMIERVEVITNPSAKFEAEGMAGIINIILKKERAKGFNGAFEVTGGIPTQYGVGGNVNYRQDRFNFFVNGNYNRRTGPATGNTYQEFYNGEATNISLLTTERARNGRSTSIQAGSDYYITDNEVLTAAFLYKYGVDNNDNFVEYRDSTVRATRGNITRLRSSDFAKYILRTDDEMEEEPTLEFSLNYDKKFEQKGHTLQASFSYQNNDETESSDLREALYIDDQVAQADIFRQSSSNAEGQNQWRTQVDYAKPLENGIKIETGLLGTFRTIDNDFRVENFVDGAFVADPNLTNNFIYQEDVAAAYANYGQEFKKWSYQAGLRAEWSFISTELLNTNELNDRSYANLFPSLFGSYKIDPTNTLQASYSRRIRRPRFWDLNPFFTLTDRRNFFSGNPNLDPEFTDSYELSHLKFWTSGNIGTSVYYRRTTDLVTRILTVVDGADNETLRRPENIGIEDNYGIELVWAYTAIKWLRLDGGLNGYRFAVDGVAADGSPLTVEANAYDIKLNARVSFWKNANLQMRGNFRSPANTVQGSRQSITSINLAASKDFLNNNMTVTLSVRDLLNNRRFRSITDTETLYAEGDFQWRPRTFTTTINYRINAKKQRKRGGYGSGDGGGEYKP